MIQNVPRVFGVGDAVPLQVGFNHPQPGWRCLTSGVVRQGDDELLLGKIRPRNDIVNVLKFPVATHRDLISDLHRPVCATFREGTHNNVVRAWLVVAKVVAFNEFLAHFPADCYPELVRVAGFVY